MRFLAFLFLLPLSVFAADWTAEDVKWETAYQAIAAMDWLQTRQIAQNPQTWHELNPVFGSHPSVARVNQLFLLGGVSHAIVTSVLPEPYKRWWLVGSVTFEAAIVGRNQYLGLNARF